MNFFLKNGFWTQNRASLDKPPVCRRAKENFSQVQSVWCLTYNLRRVGTCNMSRKHRNPNRIRLTAYVTREDHAALVRRANTSRRTLADESGLILASAVADTSKPEVLS